ncbi:MAG: class I SAM-dependent methyltransferase [Clostridia bacterium]|nr:class I SAM-dependent methyltransferase [Clostridia bacterium]
MQAVIRHYELLIDEENDPVRDPEPLRAHMDLWDGEPFLDALALDGGQDVLEIGIGTGRLAIRTASLCRHLTGIDLSPKTIARAGENLSACPDVTLLCGDFMTHDFPQSFDVIYSSLTFMHIADKRGAAERIAALLAPGGRAVISLDKDRSDVIDYGTRQIAVCPDTPEALEAHLRAAGLTVQARIERPFAWIVTATRKEVT